MRSRECACPVRCRNGAPATDAAVAHHFEHGQEDGSGEGKGVVEANVPGEAALLVSAALARLAQLVSEMHGSRRTNKASMRTAATVGVVGAPFSSSSSSHEEAADRDKSWSLECWSDRGTSLSEAQTAELGAIHWPLPLR